MRGHIRERSPNHWAIVLDMHDPETGKRKRRWHSFVGTKRQAQVRCAELIARLQDGAAVDPSRITVAQYLVRFEADWVAHHTSARTAERYATSLAHVRRHLGQRRLQALRPADLAAFYTALARSGLAPRTVRCVHAIFRKALGQAKTWGLVANNPADPVRPPPAPDRELPILQPDRARELLDALRGKPIYLIAAIALATGMRRNEILGLRWRDIDLDAGRLRVEQALEQTAAYGIRVKAPKTRNGRRTISLPVHLVTELKAHWRDQQEQRLAIGAGKAPGDSPVLATIDGKPLSPGAVTCAWIRAVDAAGMPEITLHSLRHTHASMLIASGMDVLTVSRRLGHASATITLAVYGHLIHGADDRAAQVMEAAFGSKTVADSGSNP
jgi:integrase